MPHAARAMIDRPGGAMPERPGRALIDRLRAIRGRTEALVASVSAEDQQLQSRPTTSPAKWHRGHTTWFLEATVLAPRGLAGDEPRWSSLFAGHGAPGPRPERAARGLLSRPSCVELAAWRRDVDRRAIDVLAACSPAELFELAPVVEAALAHEQVHQERMLADLRDAFALSPLRPAYAPPAPAAPPAATAPLDWIEHPGGIVALGAGPDGFAFDHERPRHRAVLAPFALATRLVTVGELKGFLRDGGYREPSLWLADGWAWVERTRATAPGHARLDVHDLVVFGLDGERVASDDEPALHLTFYEADAIARWLGGRLPTELEWESIAARAAAPRRPDGALRPAPAGPGLDQLLGAAWQWTRSAFAPYPGYRASDDAVGDAIRAMSGRQVVRGGSFATPRDLVRPTLRGALRPDDAVAFTGVRIARDLDA